jgi:hypothetical membrane protein
MDARRVRRARVSPLLSPPTKEVDTVVERYGFQRNFGLILLGIWLLLTGLMQLVPGIAIPAVIMALLALGAGFLILINR